MLTFEKDISTSATSTVSSWPQRPDKRDNRSLKNIKYYINYAFNNSFLVEVELTL